MQESTSHLAHLSSQLSANITLRQLKAFLSIAKEESITRAAEQLHLTPSAISMLIRSLEMELSVKLFNRTTRKLELTESGQRLLPTVQAVFSQLNGGIEAIHQLAAARLGKFTIATSPLLAAELIPKLIASFQEHSPGIQISLLDVAVNSETPQIAFEVAHVATAVGLVDAGLCSAILPSYTLARSELKNISVVPIVGPMIQRDIVVVSRTARELPAPCEAFIAHFKKNINDPYL